MRDTLEQHPAIVANLEEAVRRIGLEPKWTAIRGGTDGSALTQMGLPTPNLFTGGHDAHSEREWICVEDMASPPPRSSSSRRSGPNSSNQASAWLQSFESSGQRRRLQPA